MSSPSMLDIWYERAKKAEAELDAIFAALPPTWYAGQSLPARVERLQRTFAQGVKGVEKVEKELARLRLVEEVSIELEAEITRHHQAFLRISTLCEHAVRNVEEYGADGLLATVKAIRNIVG